MKNLETMKKIGTFFYKSYMFIAYFAIIIALLFINYYHFFNGDLLSNTSNILIALIGIVVLVFVNKFIINKSNEKILNIAIIILSAVFLILEILSVHYFKVNPGWDFKWIMDKSMEAATTGHLQDANYFKIFPNNVAAFIIVTLGMKCFNNSDVGAYAINVIFVFVAVIFSILNAKKIGGTKLAINVILLIIGCAPLYLYTPIVYTDTLSVAFPMIALYFFLKSEELEKKDKKRYLYIALMTLISMIGYFIKPVAAIILVAFIIDKIIMEKDFIKYLVMILVIFFIMTKIFNFGYECIVHDKRGNEQEYPLTHWIMMGLGLPFEEGGTSFAYGAYSQPDSDYTATSGNYEKKKEANILKIKERLNSFGFMGYLRFSSKKFNFIWNDGTYFVINKIGANTINTSSIVYNIVIGENKDKIAIPFMTNYNNILFLAILIEMSIEITRKEKSKAIRIMGTSIVGIVLFFVVWEARSRYIYFLIPVFCLIGAKGIMDLSRLISRKNLQNILKRSVKLKGDIYEKNISNNTNVL